MSENKLWDSWDVPCGNMIRPPRERLKHVAVVTTSLVLDPYEYSLHDTRDTSFNRSVLESEMNQRLSKAKGNRATSARELQHSMSERMKNKVKHTVNVFDGAGIGSDQNDATYVHTYHKDGAIESYALDMANREIEKGEGEVAAPKVDAPSYSFMYIFVAPAVKPDQAKKLITRLTPVARRPNKKTLLRYLDERQAAHIIRVADVAKKARIHWSFRYMLVISNRRRMALIRAAVAARNARRCKWATLIHHSCISDIRGAAAFALMKVRHARWRRREQEDMEYQQLTTRLMVRDMHVGVRKDYLKRLRQLKALRARVLQDAAYKKYLVNRRTNMLLSATPTEQGAENVLMRGNDVITAIQDDTRDMIERLDTSSYKLKRLFCAGRLTMQC